MPGYASARSISFFEGHADQAGWQRTRRLGLNTELGLDHLTRSLPTINLASRGGWNCGVSRMHCALMRQGESLFITDLNSTNGTWVNEKRLPPDQPVRLHDGAQIRLGLQKISVAFVMVDVEELVPGD